MKQDNNIEFDKEIRSILENAEEAVPEHIMDQVFAGLDGIAAKEEKKKAVVIPLWLRWGMAGIAAAAVLVCGILFRPSAPAGPAIGIADNATAMREDSPAEEDETMTGEEPETATRLLAEASHTAVPREVLVNDNVTGSDSPDESGAGISENTITHYIEQSGEDGGAEESAAGSGQVIRETEKSTETDEAESMDPFLYEDDEQTSRSRAALMLSGNVTSNGNADGISKFGGNRLPPAGLQDATIIRQTSENSTYSIPLTFGLGTRIGLGKHWAIGAGLNWTMLQRTFNGTYTKIEGGKTVKSVNTDIRHTLHYVGIPVNTYYDFVSTPRIKVYAYAGGTVEKGVRSIYKVLDVHETITHSEKVKGVQFSAGAGFGVEFNIVDQLGIYINPGIRYYFDCGQPVSIRTQQPLMMDFEIGFRIGL